MRRFLSLNEIFRFAIASESQVLEMMKLKIKAATVIGDDGRIEDLEAPLDLVKERQQLVPENLEMVRAGGHLK